MAWKLSRGFRWNKANKFRYPIHIIAQLSEWLFCVELLSIRLYQFLNIGACSKGTLLALLLVIYNPAGVIIWWIFWIQRLCFWYTWLKISTLIWICGLRFSTWLLSTHELILATAWGISQSVHFCIKISARKPGQYPKEKSLSKSMPLPVRAMLGGQRHLSSSHHWTMFHCPLVLSCLPTHLVPIPFIIMLCI